MLVSYRQPLGARQPVHVGRLQYGRLWIGHQTERIRHYIHPGTRALGAAAARARGTAAASVRGLALVGDRLRPRPLSDAALMVLVSFIAVGALVVAGFIGQAMAHWLLTLPADGSVAGGGAMAVGAAFLILMYLVFASKQGRPGAAHGRR